ncbi:hypothetical protein PsYK624_090150 [Phanerochaete sordida]|uniref:Uncharacterized protein n=1 Tax=Phanerochaete sordida TaxID=48140 RepID=A0A9P3GBS1_9APHY|nr:hypothetical protein PsYK624_090150 [Phanerochaete sordida]
MPPRTAWRAHAKPPGVSPRRCGARGHDAASRALAPRAASHAIARSTRDWIACRACDSIDASRAWFVIEPWREHRPRCRSTPFIEARNYEARLGGLSGRGR